MIQKYFGKSVCAMWPVLPDEYHGRRIQAKQGKHRREIAVCCDDYALLVNRPRQHCVIV